MYKYSYNNVAKGIRLLDKKHFLFIQEKVHASKSFHLINKWTDEITEKITISQAHFNGAGMNRNQRNFTYMIC